MSTPDEAIRSVAAEYGGARQLITTDEELLAYVEAVWGVKIPNVQCCEHHTAPAKAFCDAYFARASVAIWMASRGFGGKSYLLALLALVEAVTLGADVNVLGGSGEQSQRVLEHMDKFWMHDTAPKTMLASDPAKKETNLVNGAKIQALMASQRSVRGPHPQRLRLDEIDEMDQAILDAAQGQTMGKPGIPSQTVMSSTRQYMDGTMTTMLQRAGEKGWPVYEWCYRESLEPHGWLTQDEVERKKAEITRAMWLAEYELQEPSPDSRAIDPDAMKRFFDRNLGEFDGALHEYIEAEQPIPGVMYSTGADWARKKDFTEIITIRTDVRPMRIVAYERTQRLAWPVMIEKYNARVRRYPSNAFHDGTGIGDVIADYVTVPATGVIMVGRARADMLTNLIAAIEHDELRSPVIHALEAEYKYASVDDVFGSGSDDHCPDGIAAGALAWMGCSSGWSEDNLRDYGENKLTSLNGIPDGEIALARAAGIDVEKLLGRKK